MLKRTLTLFKPTAPPKNPKAWPAVKAMCTKWVEDKSALIRGWLEDLDELAAGPPEELRKAKEKLLNEVVETGREARKSLLALEKEYSEGGREDLNSHVHVDEAVMADLDQIYCNNYSSDGALELRKCFNMTAQSKHSKATRNKYNKYLAEVQEKLLTLSESADCTVRAESGDLRAIGLTHASQKLIPLFGPAFSRICLPIPTKSMLDDLKLCLEVDGDIMSEVLRPCIWTKALADSAFRLGSGSMGWVDTC